MTRPTQLLAGSLAVVVLLVSGCGYSEDQWQAQLSKYNQLASQHKTAEQQLAETNQRLAKVTDELAAERQRVAQLQKDLEAAGLDLSNLSQTLASKETSLSKLNAVLEEREKALAEYKARAAQLERIKARFELLRQKLNELTSLGLAVTIRNNRMVISLPGDVLFESGQDRLKSGGTDVLKKVSAIIGGDESLKSRTYQVAGHTDNVELSGGFFKDNWGLSLMRARTVLIYLIGPGGLPPERWSASGYSDTDPVAVNTTADGRQKNRRCELVVVPNAEEMLDLKNIAE